MLYTVVLRLPAAAGPRLAARRYATFHALARRVGGVDAHALEMYREYCHCLLASRRNVVDIDKLGDEVFQRASLRPLKSDFPVLNVTATKEPRGIYSRHFADALTLIPTIELLFGKSSGKAGEPVGAPPLRIADIGSGGGFPGIPLAIARPHWRITLVDSVSKKAKVRDCCLYASL